MAGRGFVGPVTFDPITRPLVFRIQASRRIRWPLQIVLLRPMLKPILMVRKFFRRSSHSLNSGSSFPRKAKTTNLGKPLMDCRSRHKALRNVVPESLISQREFSRPAACLREATGRSPAGSSSGTARAVSSHHPRRVLRGLPYSVRLSILCSC
jgi:hypothetical protein